MIPKALGTAYVRPLVRSILASQDTYGYQTIQYASQAPAGATDHKAGILYPILRRLENDGLIESYWVHPEGDRNGLAQTREELCNGFQHQEWVSCLWRHPRVYSGS